VDIPVKGHAGDQALLLWNMTMIYDKNVLTFVSFATSEIYRPCTMTRWDHADGVHEYISLATTGIGQYINSTRTEGNNVDLVALRFSVNQNNITTSTTYSGVASLFVNDMVSVMTTFLAQKVWGSVRDQHGFRLRSAAGGSLTVSSLAYVGIMAYTANSDIINTAVLTGENTYTPITVEAIVNGSSVDSDDFDRVTPSAMCHVDTAASKSINVLSTLDNLAPNATTVLLVNGTRSNSTNAFGGGANCVVESNPYTTVGSNEARVTVQYTSSSGTRQISSSAAKQLNDPNSTATYSGLNTSVPFRVWVPSIVNMKLEDVQLNRII
jgi:hypothetical protein